VALEEPYTYGKPSEPQVQTYPYAVPEGSVWVMGDNRTDSLDSRSFGAVPLDSVRGKAVWRYWPLNRLGTL
jgi:signal peptidase I